MHLSVTMRVLGLLLMLFSSATIVPLPDRTIEVQIIDVSYAPPAS